LWALSGVGAFGTVIAHSICRKRKEMIPMKIDTAFFAALVLAVTTLWARMAVQGVEQAVVSTALEYCLKRIKVRVGK
jgi:hypothetical protein